MTSLLVRTRCLIAEKSNLPPSCSNVVSLNIKAKRKVKSGFHLFPKYELNLHLPPLHPTLLALSLSTSSAKPRRVRSPELSTNFNSIVVH
ncbi:hypothetical protein CEXT_293551 [Caerostris extrusa]|uniref:Uncharacterized protein n=1 Tax=Caerostris extrusa TaxID=172846 RepID=A0AAV4QF35_CAEEX|nr:hypothetical protein CEXT_293551 [Caerostris extrusa]